MIKFASIRVELNTQRKHGSGRGCTASWGLAMGQDSGRAQLPTYVWILLTVLVALVVGLVIVVFQLTANQTSSRGSELASRGGESPRPPVESTFDEPRKAMPNNGMGALRQSSGTWPTVDELAMCQAVGSGAPGGNGGSLRISAPDGEESYFVRLAPRQAIGSRTLSLFVRPGRTAVTSVPVCGDKTVYALHYGAGSKWYGDRFTFGPTGSYGQANQVFAFKDGSTWTVSLALDPGGNLSQSAVTFESFTRLGS